MNKNADVPKNGADASMTADQFDRERFYQATLSIARTMFRQGLITDAELSLICAKMLGKYRPLLGSLSSAPIAEISCYVSK